MRLFHTSLVMLLLASWQARAAEDGGYDPVPTDRYEAMGQRSPFALATVVAAPQAPQASFAANWYVVGIGRLGESDFVTIKSRDAGMLFSLYGDEPHATNGVSLVSVSWSETVGKSTVVLRKGTEMAKLEFNEADLRTPPSTAANPGNPGQPPNPNMPMQTGNMQMSGQPSPMGTVAPPGVMPQNPVTVTPMQSGQPMAPGVGAPGVGAPGMGTPGGEIRRRVRPIPMPSQPRPN